MDKTLHKIIRILLLIGIWALIVLIILIVLFIISQQGRFPCSVVRYREQPGSMIPEMLIYNSIKIFKNEG